MNDGAASLYSAWLDAMPAFFRAMMPGNGAGFVPPSIPGSGSGTLPFPADQAMQAVGMTNAMLGQLYQAYVPSFAQGGFGAEAIKSLANVSAENCQALLGWSSTAQPAGDGLKLLQIGMERTFGALGDAFGLRPARELDEAFREMASAGTARQRAQAEYLALWAEAWNDGTQRLANELTAMGVRGERVESMLALIRLWAKNVDAAVHEVMQSERGLESTARVIREATAYREQLQKAVGLLSEALHVPTRAEVDQAYREIQQLKRELRTIRKALPPAVRKRFTTEAKEGPE